MVVRASSNGASGFFCGDVIHHPLQLRYPHINSMFCRAPEQAANTRRAVLTDCAEHDRLLMPVHFAGSSCDMFAMTETSTSGKNSPEQQFQGR